MMPDAAKDLTAVVEKRAARRSLHVDLTRMRYANRCLYANSQPMDGGHTLYVGVGHGHDALLALIDGLASDIVGIDPYIGDHGNDDQDYEDLLQIISETSLDQRFSVRRETIESYLQDNSATFDRIVCNDVLHHIFEESLPLVESSEFEAAVALFTRFREICRPGGSLLISDAGRHGLRQLVHYTGMTKSRVNYQTKQPWQQWDAALVQAGWTQTNIKNYVPYRLRQYSGLLSGLFGRHTLCDHYILTYSHDGGFPDASKIAEK
jgi:SAM-dependent methyltransferase